MNTSPYRDFIADRNHAVPSAPVGTKPAAQRPSAAAPSCGSGWYHEVAIEEAKQASARKH